MGNVHDRFDVNVSSETKLKDKNILTFEFKLLTDTNCRIKIEACQVYDCDGYMYQASGSSISTDDFILGKNSRFFTELKRVNVTISKNFKSRIGCNMVFTVIDVDDKKKMNLCFQKRSSTKWSFVGAQPLEYKEADIAPKQEQQDTTQAVENQNDNLIDNNLTNENKRVLESRVTPQEHKVTSNINTTHQEVVSPVQPKVEAESEVTEPKKDAYVPSFAKRYSTNYSAGSVAGFKKPVIKPKKEEPVSEQPKEEQSITQPQKTVIYDEKVEEIQLHQKEDKEDIVINNNTLKSTASINKNEEERIVEKEEKQEKKEASKPSGVDAFRQLLGAMADISAGKDIDLDLGRERYDDDFEEDNDIEKAFDDEPIVNEIEKDIQSQNTSEVSNQAYNPNNDIDETAITYEDEQEQEANTQYYSYPVSETAVTSEEADIPVYYRRKDSIDMLRQRIANDKNNTFLGMTLGAIMDKYDLDNQRLETFLNVFANRYKVADKSINEQELRAKIEEKVKQEYREQYKEELTEQIKQELEEQEKKEALEKDEAPKTLEFYDIEPERVEAYLNSIIEYDADAAAQIGLSLSQIRVSVSEENGSYTATLYSEASYSKETYVLVRCPIVKVIFYDCKGNIANMAMHSVSRIYTGHDIIEMKLKTAQFKYWQNIGKLKIMITL